MAAAIPLRVGTFNVHGAILGDRLTKVAALLHLNNLKLVCFQEVDNRSLRELGGRLKELTNSQWNIAYGGHSNGILTSCEIVWNGRAQMRSPTTRELRGAARCVVKHCFSAQCTGGPDCCKTVACVATHVDWKREETRLEQLQQLLDDPWDDCPVHDGYLLCGDLNALNRADYSDNDWQRIASDREHAGFYLQGPRGDVLDLLKEGGFKDSGDGFAGKMAGGLWTTSRFRTRIDYILSSRNFRGMFSNYGVVDAQSTKISDHNLVCVDVLWPS